MGTQLEFELKCKSTLKTEPQIPFGNDNKKYKSKYGDSALRAE
jgi:hypothetical protein